MSWEGGDRGRAMSSDFHDDMVMSDREAGNRKVCLEAAMECPLVVAEWIAHEQRTESGRRRLGLISMGAAAFGAAVVLFIGMVVIFNGQQPASAQSPGMQGPQGVIVQPEPTFMPPGEIVVPGGGPIFFSTLPPTLFPPIPVVEPEPTFEPEPEVTPVPEIVEPVPLPVAGSMILGDFFYLPGYNCWSGSTPANGLTEAIAAQSSHEECRMRCDFDPQCQGFIYGVLEQSNMCWLRSDVNLAGCAHAPGRDPAPFDFWMKRTPAPHEVSTQPIMEFYMYRATAPGAFQRYGLGQTNTGNLDGVVWYLMNEIVTNYGEGIRCPRRFGISELHRLKVKVRVTNELLATGMHFGPRWAYDQGKCEGRCFPGNMCTGQGDCASFYNKYGFVVGCNRFASKYPFPDIDTSAPQGVWYSMPIEGHCDGDPTGAKDCTWSWEDAGVVTMQEIGKLAGGGPDCCDGGCTNFWHDVKDTGATYWRIGAIANLFKNKYPQMAASLKDPWCDFDQWKVYSQDTWQRHDPWH